jgi:hypothetical protein
MAIVAPAAANPIIAAQRPLKPAEFAHLSPNVGQMESFIWNLHDPHYDPAQPGSTPPYELHAHAGQTARLQLVRPANSMHEFDPNGHAKYEVHGLGTDNTVRLTALLPVSGHVGSGPARTPGQVFTGRTVVSNKNENAAAFARSNQYQLLVSHLESGRRETVGNIASTGLVTGHEVHLQMDAPGTYRVQFSPLGSAGISGYPVGRTIDLVRP